MAISHEKTRGGVVKGGLEASRRARPRVVDRGLVSRTALVRRCVDAIDASVVVLQAPAGYGKTTVLSQWEAADPRPFVWVTLDALDNDAGQLMGSIATALNEVEPVDDAVFAALSAPGPQLSNAAVRRFCDALNDRERPFAIALDDLHAVQSAQSLHAIAAIAENVPLGSTLAIATREEPAISLGRLRARRLLLELHAEDLAMTSVEAAELVRSAGLELNSDAVQTLVEHTEGWPAGIYLASMSLDREGEGNPASMRTFGDHRLVADYLRDEFLHGRPAEEVEFLVRSSIFDQLSGPLCDAVLEHEGSAQVLKRLARSNLLVVPLDGRDREYRYHALLREMLEAELQRGGVEQQSELHARASGWYAEHGDVDRAVEHAIDADDLEAAGELIWGATPAYEARGRHATIRLWLDRFSEAQVAASAPLCLALAANALTLGQGSRTEHWAELAIELLNTAQLPESALLTDIARLIQLTGAARGGVVRMGKDAAELSSRLPEDGPFRSICCLLDGVSHHLAGDRAAARERLREGSRRGESAAPNIRLLCTAQLALMALDDENLVEAGALMELATGELTHFGLDEYPSLALVVAVAGLVDAHRGRPDDAVGSLRRAEEHLTKLDLSAWYEAETHIVLARTLLLLDDVAGARQQLAQAARYLRDAADADVLREWIQRAWQDADAATAMTGRWPLTPAELRLLHALPSHLSFPEIAEQFFVSPNTVKTQARSIYRKLGVDSRAEAVDCARGAGLLAGDELGDLFPEGAN